ncbi:Hypothetical predicted protein, partial [Podarcis lilfordi]
RCAAPAQPSSQIKSALLIYPGGERRGVGRLLRRWCTPSGRHRRGREEQQEEEEEEEEEEERARAESVSKAAEEEQVRRKKCRTEGRTIRVGISGSGEPEGK